MAPSEERANCHIGDVRGSHLPYLDVRGSMAPGAERVTSHTASASVPSRRATSRRCSSPLTQAARSPFDERNTPLYNDGSPPSSAPSQNADAGSGGLAPITITCQAAKRTLVVVLLVLGQRAQDLQVAGRKYILDARASGLRGEEDALAFAVATGNAEACDWLVEDHLVGLGDHARQLGPVGLSVEQSDFEPPRLGVALIVQLDEGGQLRPSSFRLRAMAL